MARRKPDSTSTKFERQIERIHSLLKEEGDDVTWNDHIPDPDNPSQPRQIDVTIRRDGRTTLIECRIHKNKQNVKWIEELKGRKDSLNATGVIAVSASGFTPGAINKANRFGIILRSIYNLSEPEIRNWGKETLVKVIYYEFTDTILTIRSPRTALKLPIALLNEDGTPIQWRSLFETAMQALDANQDLDIGRVSFDLEIFAKITVCGVRPISMSLHSVSRRIHQDIPLVSVIAYTSPEADPAQYARVAKYDLGAFEILQSGGFEEGDEVAVVVDVNPIVPPTNCFFRSVFVDFGRGISAKWFQIIGAGNFDFMNAQTQLQLRMEFV
jgi:hypothetical protein